MIKTHAPSTLCSPFDSSAQRSPASLPCAHTDVIEVHLAARRPLQLPPDALEPPLGHASLTKPRSANRRRTLRPVYKACAPSEAELRMLAHEQVFNRLVRPWMSKLQRQNLDLIVHALPPADRERFSEMASLAMQNIAPRAKGWVVFETLSAYEPAEMLAALQFCHELGICDLPADHQLRVLQQLARVAAPLRRELWSTARKLLRNNKLTAQHPDLLQSLAAMPQAQWSNFVQLCAPLLKQHWVPQSKRTKAILSLAQACLRPDELRTHARPLHLEAMQASESAATQDVEMNSLPDLAPRSDLAHAEWSFDQDEDEAAASTLLAPPAAVTQAPQTSSSLRPYEYDYENVMLSTRINATATAIVKLRAQIACPLPTLATLALIETFIANLKQAPIEAGGYLRRHRVIEPNDSSHYRDTHRYCELDNAAYALHDEGWSEVAFEVRLGRMAYRLLDVDESDDDNYTPSLEGSLASLDDDMAEDDLADLADWADGEDVNADIWYNDTYRFDGNDSIGMGELAALVWTAIDAYTNPKLSDAQTVRAKDKMRLDFVGSLAACVEDDSRRVCTVGIAQRLLTSIQAEYALDLPLYTPQDVVSVCAQEFSESHPLAEVCAPQDIMHFYRTKMAHATDVLWPGDRGALATFQKHLEGYLKIEFEWSPPKKETRP